MKTIIRITVLSLIFFALGCSKDDNEVQPIVQVEPELPEVQNKAPLDFELIAPTENDPNADISLTPSFSWNATTDPDGDSVTYDLYLDSGATAEELYAENLTDSTFEVIERLDLQQDYVWRVVAKDSQGAMVSSSTHGFSTRAVRFNDMPVTNNAGFPVRSGHSSVVFDNKLWVIGGRDIDFEDLNDVWFSSDGVVWEEATTAAPFAARTAHTSVVFDNKIWLIGGSSNRTVFRDVWFSEDGVNWVEVNDLAPFGSRGDHTSVVFDNKIWLIGGFDDNFQSLGDVWFSADGVIWTEAIDVAPFGERMGHTSVVFDDKIWVIAGFVRGEEFLEGEFLLDVKNDAWFSTDGIDWQEATSQTNFSARESHTSVVFDNKIWLTGGGQGLFNTKNDVWYSSDGIVWEEATTFAPFSARSSHSSVVYDNKVWVIGGNDANLDINLGDVWTID